MKVNLSEKPKPQILGTAQVWRVKSQSLPEHWYFVMHFQLGFVCSCPGWQNAGRCWHIDAVQAGDTE